MQQGTQRGKVPQTFCENQSGCRLGSAKGFMARLTDTLKIKVKGISEVYLYNAYEYM